MHHRAKFNNNQSKGCCVTVLKMAAVRHLGFVKFEFFLTERPILHQRTKFRKDRSNHCGDRNFCDFQHGGCRHVELSKIRNFNGLFAVGGQYASSYQISSKSVKRLQRYSDLTFFFKMAAVRHLGFVARLLGPSTKTT